MATHHLFAYGTLMEPSIQKLVIGRRVVAEPATLRGFRRSTLVQEGGAYPILVEQPDAPAVEGHVIEVTDEELDRLDEYEGEEYRRVRVRVESGLECWAYVR